MSLNINFECLPNEIIFEVFSLLGMKDLGRCGQVSKRIQEIASDIAFWSPIHKKYFSWLSIPEHYNIKKFIDEYLIGKTIRSEEEIIKNVENFAKKVQLNQMGIFRCRFPFNSDFSFFAKIAYSEPDITKEPCFQHPNLEEDCIFIRDLQGNKDLVGFSNSYKTKKKYISIKGVFIDIPNAANCTIFNKTMRIIENRIEELDAAVKNPKS